MGKPVVFSGLPVQTNMGLLLNVYFFFSGWLLPALYKKEKHDR
jgi:hypothetical protein